MKQLGIDRSSLHKTAIKEFYNRRQQSTLNLVWGKHGKDNQDLRGPLPDAYRCRQTLEDETRWLSGGTSSGGVLKQEQEEMTMALNRRVSKDLQMQPKPKETTSPNPQKNPPEKFEAARFHWCWSVRFRSYRQPAWCLTTSLEWLLPVPLLLSSRAG